MDIGETIGNYRLLSVAALKVLLPELSANQDVVTRYRDRQRWSSSRAPRCPWSRVLVHSDVSAVANGGFGRLFSFGFGVRI